MIVQYIPLSMAEYYAWNGWFIDSLRCHHGKWSVLAIKWIDENWSNE